MLVEQGELEAAVVVLRRVAAHGLPTHPKWARRYDEAAGELAAAQSHLEEAIDTTIHGLGQIAGTAEERWSGRLALVGLQATADLAHKSRLAYPEEPLSRSIRRGELLRSTLEALPLSPLGSSPARLSTKHAVRAQWDAEWARLKDASALELWVRAADAWRAIGHPHPTGYSLLRAAEDAARHRRPRAEIANPLLRAHAIAAALGAGPLLTKIETLATSARITLNAAKRPPRGAG